MTELDKFDLSSFDPMDRFSGTYPSAFLIQYMEKAVGRKITTDERDAAIKWMWEQFPDTQDEGE